jgi:hypothetical protein
MDVTLNTIIENDDIRKSKSFSIYQHIIDNLNISVDTSIIKDEYKHSDIIFPDKQEVNVLFMEKDPDLLEFIGLHEQTQGAFLTVNTDGLMKETSDEYPDSFNIIIFVDDNYMEALIEQEAFQDMAYGIPLDVSREDTLTRITNTLTHELEHAIEFMENSGGLTPHRVNDLNRKGEFGYDVYACMTGYGTAKHGKDFEEIDKIMLEEDLSLRFIEDDIEQIVEARVENNSMKKLESMDIDFNAIYKAESTKLRNSKRDSIRCSP